MTTEPTPRTDQLMTMESDIVSTTNKSTGKAEPVEVAEYPRFQETLAGLNLAVQHFGGDEAGAKFVVNRVNAQVRTDTMNKLRAKWNREPSLESIKKELATDLYADSDFMEQLKAQPADNQVRRSFIEAYVEKKAQERLANWEKEKTERMAQLRIDRPDLFTEEANK